MLKEYISRNDIWMHHHNVISWYGISPAYNLVNLGGDMDCYTIYFNGISSINKIILNRFHNYVWQENDFRNLILLTYVKPAFNPILIGGGGGSIWPPLYEIRDCLVTAADRDTPFHDFFLSSLTHLLIPRLRKSDHRSRGHVTICTRTSAQNCLCTKHMEIIILWAL